jgi:putative ABC transport system permease protein
MIISVLERRSEIGLRRALGAMKAQIRAQLLAESILLALIGGVVGEVGGIASPILIGAFAGLMPAVRASRMAPTVALRTA